MVEFNELYFNPNTNTLVIDASVKDLCYYNEVYISNVIIDNQDTFTSSSPSSSPVYTMQADNYDHITDLKNLCPQFHGAIPSEKEILEGRKRIRLEIPNLNKNDLFFVYVVCKGIPHPDTPCGMDNVSTLGITYNMRERLSYLLKDIRKTPSDKIVENVDFINTLLEEKRFALAIDLGDYKTACKIWNNMEVEPIIVDSSRCNCNG